jgi:hypothetical protein
MDACKTIVTGDAVLNSVIVRVIEINAISIILGDTFFNGVIVGV